MSWPENAALLISRSLEASQNFYEDLIGHELLETNWLGALTPHRIRCGQCGRETTVRPADIQKGKGACKYCAQRYRSNQAHADYLDFLTANEHEDLEHGRWLGNHTPHRIRCGQCRRETTTYPANIKQGKGACKYCSNGIDRAHANYLNFLAENGHEDLERGRWYGANTAHQIRCGQCGHKTTVRPASIQQGNGACIHCYVIHDVFYIVATSKGAVKFGISSGNPRGRLTKHAYWGYRHVEFLATGLPIGVPRATEDAIKSALRDADFVPEYGREYFGPGAKDMVIKLAHELLDEYVVKEVA
jgi:DNA-directed RNA polymerase subunit RPC12/RpoP